MVSSCCVLCQALHATIDFKDLILLLKGMISTNRTEGNAGFVNGKIFLQIIPTFDIFSLKFPLFLQRKVVHVEHSSFGHGQKSMVSLHQVSLNVDSSLLHGLPEQSQRVLNTLAYSYVKTKKFLSMYCQS